MFSKVSHIPIIKEIARGLQAAGMNRRYIELGIAKAACFNEIAPLFEDNIAVDIKCENELNITVKNYSFFGCSTDKFFKFFSEIKANLFFIDANHDYNCVINDFKHSFSWLQTNGIIILHDTYPPSEEYKEHCKDAYKIEDYLRSHNIQFVTLPFYYGLTIVRKV